MNPLTHVFVLYSESIAESNLLGIYVTPQAAMAAKPGQWHYDPVTDTWDGRTDNDPGWHLGHGHYAIERHPIQS